jgi:hypothetical protein
VCLKIGYCPPLRHLLFFQANGIRQHGSRVQKTKQVMKNEPLPQDTSHTSFSRNFWCPDRSCASYPVLKSAASWFPHTIFRSQGRNLNDSVAIRSHRTRVWVLERLNKERRQISMN